MAGRVFVKLQNIAFLRMDALRHPKESCLPFPALWQDLGYDPGLAPSFQRENRKEKQF